MSPYNPRAFAALRRMLRRQRRAAGASALIVLTLALALGANTAVFSVADALLLRAVPFKDADRLVAVTSAFPSIRLTGMNLSGPEAVEFQQLTRAFSSAGPYTFIGLVVQGADGAELAGGVRISKGAMEALGVIPVAGRPLTGDDYAEGGPPVALLGHGLWLRAFGGDPTIVGRVVPLGGVSRQVVGITPPGITILNRPVDVWLPLPFGPAAAGSRSDHGFNVVARLADGVSFDGAVADVRRATDVWREETGEMHVPTAKMHPLELQPLTRATTGLNREPVGALVAAVIFVLLLACANISNLLVARGEQRRGEIAVQFALGASRRRLLTESVGEGLTLAAAGTIGGLAISQGILGLLRATWPAVANVDLALDYRVLGATALVATAAGLIIGAAPVIRLDVTRTHIWLKAGSRGSVGSSRRYVQPLLIGVQIALAVLLSGCAGLMVRSLQAITSIDTGIDAAGVLRAQVTLPAGSYPDDEQVWSFYERVVEQLRVSPGVTHAAVMSGLPPQRRANNTSFLLDGVEVMDHTSIHQVEFVQHVSPGYLGTLGIRVREGRPLSAADNDNAAPVALVNETLARQFWPAESALGHRLKPAGNIGTWFTIVGIVSDVRQNGIQAPVGSEVYVTHRQARKMMSGFMPRTMNLVVRTSGDMSRLAGEIRAAVKQVDPAAAVSGIAPMTTIIDRTIAQPRLLAWMFGAFALLALVVAGIGVYAVTSSAVSHRMPEFGLRMALGAQPIDVLRLVVTGGVPWVAGGVLAGVAGTAVTARLLRNLLFRIEPLDPISLAIGAAAIAVSALVATVLPACRAARVDPLTALRD